MVIDSSFNHIVSVEFDEESRNLFLHCQVGQWNKQLKQRLLELVSQLGTCYSIVDNNSKKFNELLGAKPVMVINNHTPVLTVMRYN